LGRVVKLSKTYKCFKRIQFVLKEKYYK